MIAAFIRHAKVDIKWNFWNTSAEYDDGCARYDTAPVHPVTVDLPNIEFQRVYISALPRTEATARQVLGDVEMTKSALLNEVPECAAFDSEIKIPRLLWAAIGRIQWFFNVRRQPETREETHRRAEQFVDLLMERNEDCAVFTHGFFMLSLLSEMKKRGFVTDQKSIHFDNGECVVCHRDED